MFCWQAPAFFPFFFLSFFCLDTVYIVIILLPTYNLLSTCSHSLPSFRPWWLPYPCFFHEAHAPGSRSRLSWFIAMMLDHETLKNVGAGTRSQLSAAHKKLTAMKLSQPRPFHHGTISYKFSAAVNLYDLTAISDALIGRLR